MTFKEKMFMLIIAMMWLTSCTTTKHRSSLASDSTAVKKLDSGTVSKNENSSKTASDWWKETLLFRPPGKDTVMMQPINNYSTQPIAIIREGGTKQEENKASSTDSTWNKRLDSMQAILTTSLLNKKTEFLNWWQVLLLGAGASAAVVLILKLKVSWR